MAAARMTMAAYRQQLSKIHCWLHQQRYQAGGQEVTHLILSTRRDYRVEDSFRIENTSQTHHMTRQSVSGVDPARDKFDLVMKPIIVVIVDEC